MAKTRHYRAACDGLSRPPQGALRQSGDGGDLPVEDALALAEAAVRALAQTVGEGGPAYGGDAGRTAERLSRLRIEIGRLQANDIRGARIPQARAGLHSAVNDTEIAASRIMECAEAIMNADASDPCAYREAVTSHVMSIFEACAFQDLTGQRLARVSDNLDHIERRISRFADAITPRDAKARPGRKQARQEKRVRELMLHGPGEGGITQEEIDRVIADNAVLPRQS